LKKKLTIKEENYLKGRQIMEFKGECKCGEIFEEGTNFKWEFKCSCGGGASHTEECEGRDWQKPSINLYWFKTIVTNSFLLGQFKIVRSAFLS